MWLSERALDSVRAPHAVISPFIFITMRLVYVWLSDPPCNDITLSILSCTFQMRSWGLEKLSDLSTVLSGLSQSHPGMLSHPLLTFQEKKYI